MLLSNVLQVFTPHYHLELIARVLMGIGTSRLLTLGMFYGFQTFKGMGAIVPLALSSGLMQVVTSLCYLLSPTLFADGNMTAILVFQLGVTLIALSAVLYLPLPTSYRTPSLTWQDALSFVLLAGGVACFCAYLSLGNVLWWTTDWLGLLLAGGVGLVGFALWLEAGREKPLINWHWISARQIFYFLMMAMLTRLFTTEQAVGAGGVLNLMGFNNEQLFDYYQLIFISSIFGLIMSVATLKPTDVRRNSVIAIGLIAFGAYLDIGVNAQTPVSHFYVSQAVIAFARQPAQITVDALGGKQVLTGKVVQISPATGSEFSTAKTDPSTGNFIKIAQHVPVKITFDENQPNVKEISIGMSAVVRIKKVSK